MRQTAHLRTIWGTGAADIFPLNIKEIPSLQQTLESSGHIMLFYTLPPFQS